MSNYYSRIKDIFIQIHNYDFFHSPTDFINKDNRLINREVLTKRLKAFLDPKARGGLFSGVYLVTGFRGIGKTTLIRSALCDQLSKNAKNRKFRLRAGFALTALFIGILSWLTYIFHQDLNALFSEHQLPLLEKSWPLVSVILASFSWLLTSIIFYLIPQTGKRVNTTHRVIELNLSQDRISEFDVLKSITWSVFDEYKESLKGIRALTQVLVVIGLLFLTFQIKGEISVEFSQQDFVDPKQDIIYYLFHGGLLAAIYFVLFLLLKRMIQNLHRLGLITHKHVLNRLSNLNDRINATLIEEERTSLKHFEFNLDFGGRSRSVDKVDAKEIEYELTQIFREARQVYFGFSPRKFVIVFDELDKVDFGREWTETISGDSTDDGRFSSYYDLNPERRRREYIANLLGSLKHFFSTAKAKFIFIAGSEMFDASLADSTERDSFFGSIFHDIFYVPSFYTDEDHRTSDIKALTEKYLCRFLIPTNLHQEEHSPKDDRKYELNLKGYSKYLRKTYFLDNVMDENVKKSRKMLESDFGVSYTSYQTIINKTVYTLYNFIMYLTSRSNGSPKKLTKLLEEHIVKNPEKDKEFSNRPYYLISKKRVKSKSKRKKGLFLYFQELDQYKFGFNTYLFHPFYFTHSVYLTNHSDKLLVASSFLLAHFYKFHSLAFSRQSLEYTPEVVSYSKVPELRKFMEGLFDTISNKHIEEITSGLYTHRFRDRIANEIEFISKILQQESAIYNFTLDESLPLKRFYTSKVKEFEREYKNYNNGDETRQPFAISHLNSLLADLHFFDKDYEDSLTYYHNALKYLAYVRRHTINTFTHYVTNLLKIGLTYEKTKQYERAHGVYSRAHEELFKFVGFCVNDDDPGELIRNTNDRTRHKDLFVYSATFLLSPAIARFALFEKGGSTGVTYEDYDRLMTQIDQVLNIDPEYRGKNFLIISELNHKIGNIFYFKNSSILKREEEKEHGWQDDSLYQRYYAKKPTGPVDALYIYYENVSHVLSRLETGIEDLSNVNNLLKASIAIVQNDFQHNSFRITGRFARKLSNYLSKLGDAFLCFDRKQDFYKAKEVIEFTKKLQKLDPKEFEDLDIENDPIFIATLLYTVSARLILKEYPILSSQRLLKILYVIKDNIKARHEIHTFKVIGLDDKLKGEYIQILKDDIVKAILVLMNQANEGTRRLSLQQFKINADFPYQEDLSVAPSLNPPRLQNSSIEDLYPLIFNSSSNSAETSEVIIVFSEILLKLNGLDGRILNPAHGFNNINNQFNRMWELWHKVHLNDLAWRDNQSEYELEFLIKNFATGDTLNSDYIRRTLIVDSIYCLTEIIRSHKVFGLSYVHNYTTLAKAHERLGSWCKRLSSWVGGADTRQKEITRELEKLIHQESTTYLHKNYHFDRSHEYHKAAMNMHSGGKEYQQTLKKMYFSEDDFDDESQHFSAANERSKLKIHSIMDKHYHSEIHKYDNFKLTI